MARNDLASKYRPAKLDELVGQEHLIKPLGHALKKNTAHSFIFSGPSGTGKTTIARIIASRVKCQKNNLIEIDAATHTGVDAMRQVTDGSAYMGMGKHPNKVIIIDEAHRLSVQAWESLLKSVEEPPEHIYWIFCTTNPEKIPRTIKTRCIEFETKAVDTEGLYDLLAHVRGEEEFDTPDAVLDLVATRAEGSPRQALTLLAVAFGCSDRKDAARLLSTFSDDKEVIDLCRALAKGTTWKRAAKLIGNFAGQDAEGLRRVIFGYFTKVALGADNPAGALAVLDAFSTPYPPQAGLGYLALSVGEILLGDDDED